MPEIDQMSGVPGGSPPPSAPSPTAPPSGAPASGDQPASGEIEQAKANVQIALMLLEQTLPLMGSESEEGKDVLKAITALSRSFQGKKSKDLVPAELMQLISSMPDEYKKAAGGQGQPEGIPGGPHVPANLNA